MSKSLLSYIFVGIFLLAGLHYYRMWETGIMNFGDGWGYYLYLPATIIHGDLDTQEASYAARCKYHPRVTEVSEDVNPLGTDILTYTNGKQVNKYTCGVAILETPMFLVAHGLALSTGRPADGYSPIYFYFMHLNTVLFVMLGLWHLRKTLLRHFEDGVVAAVLPIVALGTNLFYFTVQNSGMSHAYLFSVYAFLIYHTVCFYEKPNARNAALIGISAGFIALIRPTEIIALLIPILYGAGMPGGVKGFGELLRKEWKWFALASVLFVCMGLPQLFYWKYVVGEWLHYSYGEEGFDFLKPKIIKGLFGYRNGWLAYTPLMYLAVLGIPLLYRDKRRYFLPVLIFLSVHIWITYSWWCWNYINGFGSRPMVETYALLGVPMAAALTWVSKRRWASVLVAALSLFFVAVNLFDTHKIPKGLRWTAESNAAFYYSTLFKNSLEQEDLVVFDTGILPPDTSRMRKLRDLRAESFEFPDSAMRVHCDSINPQHGKYALRLSPDYPEMLRWFFPADEYGLEKDQYVRVSIWLRKLRYGSPLYSNAQIVAVMKRPGGGLYKWRAMRLENKVNNEDNAVWGGAPGKWEEVVFWYRIPNRTRPWHGLEFFGDNKHYNPILVDNIRMELYGWK